MKSRQNYHCSKLGADYEEVKLNRFKNLLAIHLLQILSILLFSCGFFLTRPEIHSQSPLSDSLAHTGLKRFNRTVLLLVDALRYDFLVPPPPSFPYSDHENDREKPATPPHMFNVPIVGQLLKEKPENSLLMKFIADPPTTTMQRIKGVMTGSLPTFIDVSRNFGSDKLYEDNLIAQLKQQNRSVVFMGDDTWMNLLGENFTLTYPYPSFNVMDLHTVDNGVESHLYDEIKNKSSEWSLIIAHTLGLDHAGHRYSLGHDAIAEKLKQLNEIIKKVLRVIEEDTLLVVMGDHGMTSSGDHGGDSKAETEAALFLYSANTKQPLLNQHYLANNKQHWFSSNDQHFMTSHNNLMVPQIDLVSSLSLLMGTAIPFSNLGCVIPQLFLTNDTLREALDTNIAQISRYIAAEGSLFTADGKDPTMLQNNDEKISYLKNVSRSYRSLWATFDINLIVLSIFTMASACLIHVSFIHSVMKLKPAQQGNIGGFLYPQHDVGPLQSNGCSFGNSNRSCQSSSKSKFVDHPNMNPISHNYILGSFIFTIFALILSAFHYKMHIILLAAPTILLLLYLTRIWLKYSVTNFKFIGALTIPGLVYGVMSGSNSFILEEPKCILFLCNILVIILSVYSGRSHNFKLSSALYALAIVAVCSTVTCSLVWHPESQHLNPILKPLSNLNPDDAHLRLVVTVILLIAFVLLTLKNLKQFDNLHFEDLTTASVWFTFAVPLCAVAIIVFWCLGMMPHEKYEGQSDITKILFPRIVYLIVFIGLVLFICDPVMVHVRRLKDKGDASNISLNTFSSNDPSKIIPQLAKSLFPNEQTPHNLSLPHQTSKNGLTQKFLGKSLTKASKNGCHKNGFIKNAHAQNNLSNSAASSRSSSIVSNVSCRSRNTTSSSMNNQHINLSPAATWSSVSKKNDLRVQGLHTSALASWHLISTPVVLLLYLLVGNGPSLGLSMLIVHAMAICHISSTAIEQPNTATQETSTVSEFPTTANGKELPQVFVSSSNDLNDVQLKHMNYSHKNNNKHRVDNRNNSTAVGGQAGDDDEDGHDQSNVDGVNCSTAAAFITGVLLALLSSYYFYITAHQLSISSIRFEVGFTGFIGDFDSFLVPGFLVVCNTFCAQILVLVFLPMIVYTRFVGGNTNCGGLSVNSNTTCLPPPQRKAAEYFHHSMSLIQNADNVNQIMTVLITSFSLTIALKVLLTMICSTLLRYHLMAYRIFVPNLMFQVVTFAVVLLVQIFISLAHNWLMYRTKRFLTALNSCHH